MKSTFFITRFVWVLAVFFLGLNARAQEISGVFGLSPVTENAALAVWVPLGDGEAISGIRWYNNDGSKAFPQLLAVAGDADYPSLLNEAYQVGANVVGATLGWSEMSFDQPLASATSGLFLVFKVPSDGAFATEGEGCGLGYMVGDGQVRSWVSVVPGEWSKLSPEYQMAVTPVMNTAKSGDVLVLGTTDGLSKPSEKPEIPMAPALQVGPNPFNPATTISYAFLKDGDVSLIIYDVRGRRVATLAQGWQTAGTHTVTWNGQDDRGARLPSGVYLAQMRVGKVCMTRRMSLVQ